MRVSKRIRIIETGTRGSVWVLKGEIRKFHWNLVFRHIYAKLWLIRDLPVVSSGGNWSNLQKKRPNPSQLSYMPRPGFEPRYSGGDIRETRYGFSFSQN